jgi:hypothetical protein
MKISPSYFSILISFEKGRQWAFLSGPYEVLPLLPSNPDVWFTQDGSRQQKALTERSAEGPIFHDGGPFLSQRNSK